MTVCISSVAAGEKAIVSASDRMISMGGIFSGDRLARKADPIAYGWISQFAGNDVSPAIPIINSVDEKANKHHDLAEMVGFFRDSYQEQRLQQIEDEILSLHGMSWEEFNKDGKTRLNERTFDQISSEIAAYGLSLTFIVSGFDHKRTPHIFTVDNPGKIDYYDKLGFWAIGSGQHQAIASMFLTQCGRFDSLEETVTKVLGAKFAAESAVGVGKDTFVLIDHIDALNKSILLDPNVVGEIRKQWESIERFPKSELGKTRKIIESHLAEKIAKAQEQRKAAGI
jgi:hypothetical protein